MAVLKTKAQVKLRHTDAAGILYFANQFNFLHDAYELLLEEIGFPLKHVFESEDFLLPIVHAESDYLHKLTVGDAFEVVVQVAEIGESSFTLSYELMLATGSIAGKAKTVHVTVNRDNHLKIALPEHLRAALIQFRDRP